MRYPWLGKSADYDWKLVDKMLKKNRPASEIAQATGLSNHQVQVYRDRFGRGRLQQTTIYKPPPGVRVLMHPPAE